MLKKSCGWWPIWYLLFFCHGGAEDQLQWVVKEKVTDYGQNLTLFYPVKNCCSDGAGWSAGPKTLFLDVITFSNDPNVKYHGTYNTDGFGVVIRNLSEADLNVTYRCVYDFKWSTPKYLLHGDVFKESTDVFKESTDVFKESTDGFKESTEVPDKDKENDTAAIVGSIFGAGAGIYIVGGIIIGIIAYCMRRKNKRPKSKGRKNKRPKSKGRKNKRPKSKGTDEEMTPFNDSDNQMDNQPGRKMKRQNSKGTGEESKSLTDSINLTENQQDMAEAESNIVRHSDTQAVLAPLNAETAITISRRAVERELRIALVGKTGVGKSATANTICGRNYFKSKMCAQAVTKSCQQLKVTILGKEISIIDTPGIFDVDANQSDVEREIQRCVHLGSPGLHAILLVMEINRITKETITAIGTLLNLLGDEMENKVIVVFTHGDILLKDNITLPEYLKQIPNYFKEFLDHCENRVIVFNNTCENEQNREQVDEILVMIGNLKRKNELVNFIDNFSWQIEQKLQKREVVIRKGLEMKYKAKLEEYKNTVKINVQREVMQERLDEMDKLRKEYEKQLQNVREEVRNEIESEESTCTIQ